MNLYFKKDAESDLGAGIAYVEISDGWPHRQIEIYGSKWRWADETHPQFLGDQPLEEIGFTDEDRITQVEFEQIWTEAVKHPCSPWIDFPPTSR